MCFDPATCRADAGDTFGYMAPELFSRGAKPSKEADMYAFGMVVYEVITGARPFRQCWPLELPLLITRGVRPNRPEDPVAIGFGQGTWEFVVRCWDGNRERRPTAGEALRHFEQVARASTVTDPGSTISVHGADDKTPSELDIDPERYRECRGPDSIYPIIDTISSRIVCPPSPDQPKQAFPLPPGQWGA